MDGVSAPRIELKSAFHYRTALNVWHNYCRCPLNSIDTYIIDVLY